MSARRSLLSLTLDAVEALLPRNCRERLEELERSCAPERACRRPAGKAASQQSELLALLKKAACLAAKLGPLWHAAGAGIVFAKHAAREAARAAPVAIPPCTPRKAAAALARDAGAGQLRLWDGPEK